MLKQIICFVSFLCWGLIWPLTGFAADSFNILLYHHVSSTAPRSTSLSAPEFEEHLEYLNKITTQ